MNAFRFIAYKNSAMSLWRRAMLTAVTLAYLTLWIGGVAHHWLVGEMGTERDWLAALFLFLAGLIIILSADSTSDRVKLAVVALLGFIIELFGASFGLPFGAYNYTDVLRPQLFGVPLVMAFAWMILVAYVKQMLLFAGLPLWAEMLIAASWMTAIDLLIDPLAANHLGYWRWLETGSYYGIPASNFAGWFVMSLLIFGLLRHRWRPNSAARFVGISVLLFFTLIALAYGLFSAALIGCGLFLAHIFILITSTSADAKLTKTIRSTGREKDDKAGKSHHL